jgi:hypothetical protein
MVEQGRQWMDAEGARGRTWSDMFIHCLIVLPVVYSG